MTEQKEDMSHEDPRRAQEIEDEMIDLLEREAQLTIQIRNAPRRSETRRTLKALRREVRLSIDKLEEEQEDFKF